MLFLYRYPSLFTYEIGPFSICLLSLVDTSSVDIVEWNKLIFVLVDFDKCNNLGIG